MKLTELFHTKGFFKIAVIDGAEAGIDAKRLILAFMSYTPDSNTDISKDAVIHPYYPISQIAYLSASRIADDLKMHGIPVNLRTDIPLKPVLNRLDFIKAGRNTLGFIQNTGSRFHVQSLTVDTEMPITDRLKERVSSEAEDICRQCGLCEKHCPTHAIASGRFDNAKCIRNWMLCGKAIPFDIRIHMGNRLIGCDICQSVCPLNIHVIPCYQPELRIDLKGLLNSEIDLSSLIGRNLAVRNRVLAQACIIASNCGRKDLLPQISELRGHNSPNVKQCAEYAYNQLLISASEP